MLFLLNKTQPSTLSLLSLFGGEEEKYLLLVEDAVFYANEAMVSRFKEAGVEEVYALEQSVQERAIDLASEVEVVDYERVVDLLMEEHEKVVCI